jgi:hypothetical protein
MAFLILFPILVTLTQAFEVFYTRIKKKKPQCHLIFAFTEFICDWDYSNNLVYMCDNSYIFKVYLFLLRIRYEGVSVLKSYKRSLDRTEALEKEK